MGAGAKGNRATGALAELGLRKGDRGERRSGGMFGPLKSMIGPSLPIGSGGTMPPMPSANGTGTLDIGGIAGMPIQEFLPAALSSAGGSAARSTDSGGGLCGLRPLEAWLFAAAD